MPIIQNTNEQYHASEGFSKSFLWAMHTKTPYAARFGQRKESNAFDIGNAAHIAILEPHLLEASVAKGPEDRRGNKWKFAEEEANAAGRMLLTASDYDQVLLIRDLAESVPELEQMRSGKPLIENSCYAKDEETGLTIRCRPDLYNEELSGMVDVKNLADISDDAWSRDIGKWGFAMQDAMYRDVWLKGSGKTCDFFFFVCLSKTEPPEVICRELEAIDIEEGFQSYRAALLKTAECVANKNWPGQPTGIIRGVKMRDRDRRFTPEQWNVKEDEDVTEHE